MKIKIGFSRNKKNKIGSRLIQWWMGTKFSHTFFLYKPDILDNEIVFQAIGSGVNFLAYDNFLDHNHVVSLYEIDLDNDQYRKLINKFVQCSGNKYGYWQNIGDLVSKIFKLNRNIMVDGTNCSTLVSKYLKELDPEAFKNLKDLNLVTPKDVYDYLKGKYGEVSQD
jgi:hypothetical protein